MPSGLGERALLAILGTAALAYSVMQTMVLPAIPALGESLDADPVAVTWVVSAFFVSSAVSIPVVGRLGDVHGRVRVLTVTMAVFAVATLAAALAPTLEALVAARVVQGVGAAVFPLSYAIVRDLLEGPAARRGMGVVSATFGVGSGVGYVLGGPVLDALGWRGLFWVGLPAAVATVALLPLLPRVEGTERRRMDWAGAAVLSVALASLLLAIGEGGEWGWTSPATAALAVLAVVGTAAWVVLERRVAEPMADMGMFLRPAMVRINACAFMLGYALFAMFVLVPGFVSADPDRLGYGFATPDQEIGLYFAPYALTMVVGGLVAGRAANVRAAVVLRAGAVAMVVGLGGLATMPGSTWLAAATIGVVGFGTGAGLTALAEMVIDAVREDETAVASGLNTMTRMIGMSVAAQAGAAVLAAHLGPAGIDGDGYALAFLLGAIAAALAFAGTFALGDGAARAAEGAARTA
ncbi:MAG: MFS transporter [Solirubrobacteraceae bacterium]|nr:MFS transporter [Solirubrobacteraceae bacterium]